MNIVHSIQLITIMEHNHQRLTMLRMSPHPMIFLRIAPTVSRNPATNVVPEPNTSSPMRAAMKIPNAPPTKPSAYANISLTTRWGSTNSIARPQASLTSWLHVSGIVGTNSIWSMKNRKAQRYIASSPTNAAWSAALCQKPLQPSSVRSSIPARKTLRFMTIFIPISRN